MSIDLYANDSLCITGDSLTFGNSDASVNIRRGLRTLLKAPYTRLVDGLGRVPGAKVASITSYDQGTPKIIPSGVAGDPIETCTANFAARVGNHNPKVLILGLGANNTADAIPGTLNPKIDALITKITTASNYTGGVVPAGWLWWGCAWRGSETPGGTNQAALTAMNAVINTKVVAAGGVFVDTQTLWLALNGGSPPASGTYTADLTHFTQAGSDWVASQIMAQIRLRTDTR